MEITFITDYVCPYCIVAKEALVRAIKELNIEADLITEPFELTPMCKPQVDTYNDPVRRSHYTVLEEPVKKLGMSLHIPPAVVPRPYTHFAFEGYYVASGMGLGNKYSDAIYLAYFKDERDIGDMNVIIDVAKSIGLDPEMFKTKVESHIYSDLVNSKSEYARNTLKIKGVPTIYIDGEEIDSGDYTVEHFKSILLSKSSDANSIGACGPDGCSF